MAVVLPNLIAAAIVAGLAVSVTLRRPPPPLWPSLLLYLTFVLVYLVGDTITLVSTSLFWEQVGIAVLYSGSIPASAACWILAIRYAEAQGHRFAWATAPWIWAPVALTSMGWLAMLSNPWHGEFLVPVIGDHNEHRWMWWTFVPFGYALVTGSVILYGVLAYQARDREIRRNAITMASGILLTLAVNFLSYATPFESPFDLTVVGLGMTSALFLYGTYRTRLFGLLPVALPQLIWHEPDGIALVDGCGRSLYANPAAADLIGLAVDEPQQDVLALLCAAAEDAEFERDELARMLLDPRATAIPELGPFLGSRGRWLSVTSTPMPDRRGRILAFSLRFHDVTALQRISERLHAAEERQQLEQRLQRARRIESLGVLAGGIAHDFNNVLAVIVGNARLGLEELGFPNRLRRRLERIERAGDFAVELTNQILTTAGKRSLRLAVVDVSRLVAGMVDLLRASISPKAELEVELRDDLPTIHGDATQLRQLTMNLVRNAADALGGSEGRIVIRTGVAVLDSDGVEYSRGLADLDPGEHVFLEVSDTGPGMDESTRDRIFEPFFSTRQSGRGLGLAAVRGIADAHRAAITLETGPGRGCAFRVLFPGSLGTRIDVGEQAGHATITNPSGTVLVVDDDPAVLELAAVYLERVGFEVIPSNGGEEALRIFEERTPDIDVVVLDLGMPGLDGQATFVELQRRKPHVRVVVVSGYGREVASERFGFIDQAQAFLSKPYEPEVLIERIREALAS